MSFDVSKPVPSNFWSAYLDWAAVLQSRSDHRSTAASKAARWRPVFVQANDPAMTVKDFFAKADADKKVRYHPVEKDLNGAEMRPDGTAIEATLYLPEDDDGTRAWFTPVHFGAGVGFEAATEAPTPMVPKAKTGKRAGTVLGIVDDGIAFLNARFRVGSKSRFDGIWLQSVAQGATKGGVDLGKVIWGEGITKMIAKTPGVSEAAMYRAVNEEVMAKPGLVRTVELAASHGTHVLDVAAGADPVDHARRGGGDPDLDGLVRKTRILGVQLPPEAVDDTSGVRMESHVIQGLRWMILAAQRGRVKHLVVNLSLGVVAGPKNGSRFIEQQMKREAEKAKKLGLNVDLVLPFGNDFETRLVARAHPKKGANAGVGLWLQRDDQTPSYVELRDVAAASGLDKLKVGLTAPDGSKIKAVPVPQGSYRSLTWNGSEIGRLYHTPARVLADGRKPTPSVLTLAMAPTAFIPGETAAKGAALAPAGRWQVNVEHPSADGVDLALMCQRDDAAIGYVTLGRQVFFDDAEDHGRDAHDRDYTGLTDAGMIRHEGTNNAYATAQSPMIHRVAAAHERPTGDRASRYSALGDSWSGGNPEGSAVTDRGDVFEGLRGAGNASGSTAQYFGTSVSAARYSRHLITDDGLPVTKTKPAQRARLGAKIVR